MVEMREIKFRGYAIEKLIRGYTLTDKNISKSSLQWVYGGIEIRCADDLKTYCIRTMSGGVFEVETESIGQYTGIEDKNGKEIYEGDIYHMGDPNITYTVIWSDTGLIGKQNGSSSSYVGLESWKDKIEVVGNIYEKELIEMNSNENNSINEKSACSFTPKILWRKIQELEELVEVYSEEIDDLNEKIESHDNHIDFMWTQRKRKEKALNRTITKLSQQNKRYREVIEKIKLNVKICGNEEYFPKVVEEIVNEALEE